eukprot:CAMPEP_0116548490 /NCGR_PEP_ID=MMETSP0397-20121206/4363_1 /TAXON_ID=216820 /ORGANISM="Cyclophora tenuis, Strain ECT3854" /LENGTH=202 /DNA_ID=CAMNT_0004073141 /DNA_START=1 /DNA_END=606 /DNA_ORIENTATION=-
MCRVGFLSSCTQETCFHNNDKYNCNYNCNNTECGTGSGGPDTTKAPSAEVDMDWTLDVLRVAISDEGGMSSAGDPHADDPDFYEDWRNDPERQDLITDEEWNEPGPAKDRRDAEIAAAEAAKAEAEAKAAAEAEAKAAAEAKAKAEAEAAAAAAEAAAKAEAEAKAAAEAEAKAAAEAEAAAKAEAEAKAAAEAEAAAKAEA